MNDSGFQTITVVGVGLLGGSLGLAAKAANPAVRVVGVGHRAGSLEQALAAGVADEVTLDPAAGVAAADLVVLCTPVGRFEELLKGLAGSLKPGAVVTDVGSTKGQVVRLAERLVAGRAFFVGSHPMAGGEQRGVTFSRADLFAGRTCILTPTDATNARALRRVEAFWRRLGMHTVRLSPAAHDRALARVSHLPHALAALLVNVQREGELDLAGPGFIDATRIAGGDPAMWRDIFLTNRPAMLAAIRAMGRDLGRFADAVERADGPALVRLLSAAQDRRAGMLRRRMRQRRVEG